MNQDNTPTARRRAVGRLSVGLGILLAGSLAGQALPQSGSDATVPYPEGYRTWVHVKTGLVSARHPDFARTGGYRHIYANPQAMTGYRTGTFPEGSVIVVDWLEAVEQDGAFAEGDRRRLDVMMKDQARFASTRGWGFEQFTAGKPGERGVTAAATACVPCHAGPGSRDLVFSKFRE